MIFYNASLMAWGDPDSKLFSPQDFRDVLQTALERVEVNPNMISPMLGHKVKGVDKHYSNHNIEEYLLIFRKALPWLIPQTVQEVKAEVTIVENENMKLKAQVNEIYAMLQRLSDKQRKAFEEQMQKSEEQAQEAERQERAKILQEQAKDESIETNLKKLPKIFEYNNKAEGQEGKT